MNYAAHYGQEFVTPLGLSLTLLMCFLLLVLPRRWALVPLLVLMSYMTMGERFLILTLDFNMLRLLLLAGAVRVLVRMESRGFVATRMDRMILWFALATTVAYTLLWASPAALVNKIGRAYDILGVYFLCRFLIREPQDIIRLLRVFAFLIVPLAISMVVEKSTRYNIFGVFGAVPFYTLIRDGILRCQGPFRHPILAGSFGAALAPMMLALLLSKGKGRIAGLIGFASATAITLTSGSSGPILSWMAGIAGLCFWVVRKYMLQLRWAIVAGLVGLEIVMTDHVWFIVTRIKVFSGSTAYHRARLIDQAIRRLPEWFLVGTQSTSSWGFWLFDVTNQYIRIGVDGGLLCVVLFVALIVIGFSAVGSSVKGLEGLPSPPVSPMVVWGLGASLWAHVVSFMGVAYFDQNIVNWYFLLAMFAFLEERWGLTKLAKKGVAKAKVWVAKPPVEASGLKNGKQSPLAGPTRVR